jgi:transposase
VRLSRLTGKDDYIKARLEEGYSFRYLSKELAVSHQTLINYVKGLDRRYREKRTGISFRKPSTTSDLARRYDVPTYVIRDWLREGRIKGRKIGHRWVIDE